MSHPTIYMDTNVLSMLHVEVRDLRTAYFKAVTQEWWHHERQFFRLVASTFTEFELTSGVYRAQAKATAECRRLPYLAVTAEVRRCLRIYTDSRLVPADKPGDAAQLAVASVHAIDYLLTWNYAHLANPQTQRRLEEINDRYHWRTPIVVSPENIPKVRLGQSIRRQNP